MLTFLVLVPVINIVAIVIGAIISAFSHSTTSHSVPFNEMPDGEKYANLPKRQEEWPSLAEQMDGRLTNVFKNPYEGIL